jgi:hypothetical protein
MPGALLVVYHAARPGYLNIRQTFRLPLGAPADRWIDNLG